MRGLNLHQPGLRNDPDWFTPYQRRETVEWEDAPVLEAAE